MFGPRNEKNTANSLLLGRSASRPPAPVSPPPLPSHSLNLPRVLAPIRDHQPIPQRQRLLHLKLIHLIEHEGEAGASIRRLAYEPYVGIALTVCSIVCKVCLLSSGNTPTCPHWHLLQDRIIPSNDFLKALGNFVPVEHVYQNRQVGILKCFLQPR